jgi:carboxyl-terminal processing protease
MRNILIKYAFWFFLCIIAPSLSVFAETGSVVWTWVVVETWAISSVTTKVTTGRKRYTPKPRPVTLQKFFVDVCDRLGTWMPEVYKDIELSWPWVEKGTNLYRSLQKCAYYGIVGKREKIRDFSNPVTMGFVEDFFLEKLYIWLQTNLYRDDIVYNDEWEKRIRYRVPTYYAIQRLLEISGYGSDGNFEAGLIKSPHFSSFSQVYNNLKDNFYYFTWSNSDEILLYWAIEGMVNGLHDKYSVFFSPEQLADFVDSTQWEYYGVGMYVEARDWYFTVSSTMKWSPAYQAGIEAGDIVLQVDNRVVPEKFTMNEVVSKIKWPVGTKVKLTILRFWQQLEFVVERKKIVIPMLEFSIVGKNAVFTITSFWRWLTRMFEKALIDHKDELVDADKVLIDLRNNPWWYLDEAQWLLSFFVPNGSPVITMKTRSSSETLNSMWYDGQVLQDKKKYILINGWTASAAEILTMTLKEYNPDAVIVGEKSYGKWSVQTMVGLLNWSSIKYTLAMWYSWKEWKSIELVWVDPDRMGKDDPKTAEDELLQQVLQY